MLNRDADDTLNDANGTKDREITLGTTMILGIFFALAMLCAVFFGFGYQLGHKAVVIAPVTASTESPSTNTNFAAFKPAAGNPVGSTSAAGTGPTVTVPLTPRTKPEPTTPHAQESPAAAIDKEAAGDVPAPAARPSPPASPANAPEAATSAPIGAGAIVQIAAVSHQEDADLLVTTLKRRGYNVAIRNEPQDKLLHVQVGPFGSHKEADVMRQKLLADGFNAIVKDTR